MLRDSSHDEHPLSQVPWRLGVPLRNADFFACSSCSLVWSELRPDELRAHIEKYGDESAKARLPKVVTTPGDGGLAGSPGG